MQKIALYIHFPYCEYKCHYCDFNSYVLPLNEAIAASYIQDLKREWEGRVSLLKDFRISSVFLGGGTPSLFLPKFYGELFGFLKEYFEEDIEITLEANPKSLNEEKLRAYQGLGINRFSIGIQSFQDPYLKPLGRLHSAEEALDTLGLFRKLGLRSFNLDLMYGFPQQTLEEVEMDLEIALGFKPEHLSFYQLTLEPGTQFFEEQRLGKWKMPESDDLAAFYDLGEQKLQEAGYQHYEISNYSQPHKAAQHNLAYWNYENYLGLGAGAVSFLREDCFREPELPADSWGRRWMNAKAPREYHRKAAGLEKNKIEFISEEIALKEAWMMGLRLEAGLGLQNLSQKFSRSQVEKSLEKAAKVLQKGFLVKEGERIYIPKEHRLMTNEIVLEFF